MGLNISAINCKNEQISRNQDRLYPQPGNPQQNAYVERFNRTVRYDWLNQNIFESIEEVQEKATHWLWHYNNERPNIVLGGITPIQKLQGGALEMSTFNSL